MMSRLAKGKNMKIRYAITAWIIMVTAILLYIAPAWLRHARANRVLANAAREYDFDYLLGIDGSANFAHFELDDDKLIALVPHFRNHLNLRSIDLSGTPISDRGLAHLTNLPNLDHLNLTATAVTVDGVNAAKVSLPTTSIKF
jgi:hypothetical protein